MLLKAHSNWSKTNRLYVDADGWITMLLDTLRNFNAEMDNKIHVWLRLLSGLLFIMNYSLFFKSKSTCSCLCIKGQNYLKFMLLKAHSNWSKTNRLYVEITVWNNWQLSKTKLINSNWDWEIIINNFLGTIPIFQKAALLGTIFLNISAITL
jgi:hypothetical protein